MKPGHYSENTRKLLKWKNCRHKYLEQDKQHNYTKDERIEIYGIYEE